MPYRIESAPFSIGHAVGEPRKICEHLRQLRVHWRDVAEFVDRMLLIFCNAIDEPWEAGD